MDGNKIQNVMLERILSRKNKLSDFYDVFAYDIIEEDINREYGTNLKETHNITLLDIITVGNFLIKEKKLNIEDIQGLVLHINSEVGNGINSFEYIEAVDNITDSIKREVGILNGKIKAFKNRDKAKEELIRLSNRKLKLVEEQEEVSTCICRIKGTIDDLQYIKKKLNVEERHNKRDLLFKKHLKMAGLYEASEKVINPFIQELIDEANTYIALIETGNLPLKELSLFVYKLDSLEIKDNDLKGTVKYILSILKSKANQMNEITKKNRKRIKNFVKREFEIKNYRFIDLKEYGEIITKRNNLKSSIDILNELKKQSTYSSTYLKRKIRTGVNSYVGSRFNQSVDVMIDSIDSNDYYDSSLDEKEYRLGLSTYNEAQDLMLIRENSLSDYSGNGNVKDVFFFENASGFTPSNKYAFSVEENDKEIKVRMHIQNIQPYISEKMYSYLYSEFFKSLSDDYLKNDYVSNVCSKYYDFKEDEVRPTIAYTFTFDKYSRFQSFDIEETDAKLRKINNDEKSLITKLFRKSETASYDENDFFENLLLREFLKYVTKNNIPFIFYGKPIDTYGGKYNVTKKKCSEKMGDKLEEFSEVLKDVDRKTYENISYKWYKNEKKYHFSLDLEEDFKYYVRDLKLLEPFSFQGYNLERLINLLVLNKEKLNQKQLDHLKEKLHEEQKRFITTFNGACKYIDVDSFIDIVGKENGKVKNKNKR